MNNFSLFILRTLAWILACIVSVVLLAYLLIRADRGAPLDEFWIAAVWCAVVTECIRPDSVRLHMLLSILRDES